MANIIQTFPAGAGGGHTVLDTDGTAVVQESKIQFVGASVTDDSSNGITKVAGEGLNSDSIDDIAGATSLVPAVIIGDANNYSISEKVVGKWIDGKPLYQKTFTVSIPSTTDGSLITKNTNVSTLNIDTLIKTSGVASFGTSVIYTYTFDSVFYANTDYFIRCLLDKTHNEFLVQTNKASFSDTTVTITIQYTKTTD